MRTDRQARGGAVDVKKPRQGRVSLGNGLPAGEPSVDTWEERAQDIRELTNDLLPPQRTAAIQKEDLGRGSSSGALKGSRDVPSTIESRPRGTRARGRCRFGAPTRADVGALSAKLEPKMIVNDEQIFPRAQGNRFGSPYGFRRLLFRGGMGAEGDPRPC